MHVHVQGIMHAYLMLYSYRALMITYILQLYIYVSLWTVDMKIKFVNYRLWFP